MVVSVEDFSVYDDPQGDAMSAMSHLLCIAVEMETFGFARPTCPA